MPQIGDWWPNEDGTDGEPLAATEVDAMAALRALAWQLVAGKDKTAPFDLGRLTAEAAWLAHWIATGEYAAHPT